MLLTEDQTWKLTEKHGWFTYGDAQGDVTRAFINDVIMMQRKMEVAAPDMLRALQIAYKALCEAEDMLRRNELDDGSLEIAILTTKDAITKAEYIP